jgi:hypothetical protein
VAADAGPATCRPAADALAVDAYLGLRGASISRAPSLPSPPAATSPTPPGVAGRLDLGTRYATVEEAATAAGFQPRVPESLGAPDDVYYLSGRHTVTLLYHPRAGLPATDDPEVGALVMQAPASLPDQPFVKVVDSRTTVKPVTVNGGSGYWISGAPHAYFFYRGGMDDRFRLAGNVLIWNQGSLVIRIESSLGQAEATGVAHSIS